MRDYGGISGSRCYPPVFTSKCMTIGWLHGLAGVDQFFVKGGGFKHPRGSGGMPPGKFLQL